MEKIFKDLTIKTLILLLLLIIYTTISILTGSFKKKLEISNNITKQKEDIKEYLNDDYIDDVEGYAILLKGTGFVFSIVGLSFIIIFIFLIQFITIAIFLLVFLKNLISYFIIKGQYKKWKINICRILWILSIIQISSLLIMFIILLPFIKLIPYIGVMILILVLLIYYNIKIIIKNGLFKNLEYK